MSKYKVLDSNAIKIIAIVAMTIDHIAWAVFPGYPKEVLPMVMHIVGRLTCPIMCYFIAEGYHYTRDINKYTLRLFLFAIVSHFAYIFASTDYVDVKSFIPFYYGNVLNQTSVMWSLAWGLVMLRVVMSEKIQSNLLNVGLVVLICLVSFPSDWSCVAALCIMAIGANRGNFKAQMSWMILYVAIYSLVYFFALDKVYGLMQMAVVLSIPVIYLYNGKRGKNPKMNKFMKWFFYLYYPVHLLIIGVLRILN
ncbi:MAG: TraX family protein [Lachnospiraceae bacterium]|nr:conjugal transfer protein TraX [Lachnospiraceae bacterium]MDD6191993.1 TraX family protein [Lachnospiraceae bacterium]